MTQLHSRPSFSRFLVAATLFFAFTNFLGAQSNPSISSAGNSGTTSLDGLTEAILVNGQPAFRIQFQKNVTSEVKLEKRDGEEALVFNVMKIILSVGKLYVTKTSITYIPSDDSKKFFKIDRSKITDVRFKDHWRLNGSLSNVNINYEGDEKAFSLIFPSRGDKQILLAANNYLFRAIKDFDNAVSEFHRLTSSVREIDEEEADQTVDVEVFDKYDRFRDATVISTSKMLVRGSKRSIRTNVEYNFAGKSQKEPESVSLSFYASAARPLFREDNLELNFLVDDTRVPLGELRMLEEEKTKTATKQTVVISVPYKTFARIANAKKVEFQIGTLEYKLTDIHLEAFRKLLAYKIAE